MQRALLFSILSISLFGDFAIADPVVGKSYAFSMVDVDGRTLSTHDGHVTVLVIVSRREVDKARIVGNRIPERCLGNPASRMITVIRFDQTRNSFTRYLLSRLIRRQLDAEANQLKSRYIAKKLTSNPRSDVYAVADFDGQMNSTFGLSPGSGQFRVLILSGKGELLHAWTDVPTAEQLDAEIPNG